MEITSIRMHKFNVCQLFVILQVAYNSIGVIAFMKAYSNRCTCHLLLIVRRLTTLLAPCRHHTVAYYIRYATLPSGENFH